MDKQTNILTNSQNLSVPVNTRTIGAPEGIYILYIEDYVHTFIRKILSESTQGEASEDELQQRSIALYGGMIEENGRYRIVISGATASEGGNSSAYFPSCSYIGNAIVSYNKDSRLRLELTLRSTKVVLDDFYIYYDQNEEMQNYLVEWNTTRECDKSKIVLSPTEHSTSDAARLGRITQAYNREEAKVSFMWNVMNVLCLGFVVCVMAYGIISMNNYNKMQNMQEKIDYCMAFVEENTSFLMGNTQTENNIAANQPTQGQGTAQGAGQPAAVQTQMQGFDQPDTSTVSSADQLGTVPVTGQDAEQPDTAQLGAVLETGQNAQQPEAAQTPDTEQLGAASAAGQNAEQPDTAQPEAVSETIQGSTQPDTPPETMQALAKATVVNNDTQTATDQTVQSEQEQSSTPQYYVVRRGDTLRTICYSIYGDYSRVDEVCKWNNIDNPDNILYGQKLLLP